MDHKDKEAHGVYPPQHIVTPRLTLRPPDLDDAPILFATYTADPEVLRFLTWRPHTTIADTAQFLQRCLVAWEQQTSFPWVITLTSTQQPIGMVEVRIHAHTMTFGYVLGRSFWGHGYMPEVIQSLVQWGITQPTIYRVWTVCDVANHASRRVLEKAGLQCEGILRRWIRPYASAEPRDTYCFALVK